MHHDVLWQGVSKPTRAGKHHLVLHMAESVLYHREHCIGSSVVGHLWQRDVCGGGLIRVTCSLWHEDKSTCTGCEVESLQWRQL